MNITHVRPASFGPVLALVLIATGVSAQDAVSPADFALVPTDSWPTFHGDYSGRRHSTLTQITPDNVHTLTLAWLWNSNAAPRRLKARR
jgi:alcohol dehydrogenase (cytochrome c)